MVEVEVEVVVDLWSCTCCCSLVHSRRLIVVVVQT